MALKFSTGLVNALAGELTAVKNIQTRTDLALNDNGASDDTLVRDAGSWIDDGYVVGDQIVLSNTTSGSNSSVIWTVKAVAALTLTIQTGSLAATQAKGNAITIANIRKRSLRDLFNGGCVRYYSGSAPATADAAETGTLLVELTRDQATFVAGNPATGFTLDTASGGVSSKTAGQRLSGVAVADGTAGYFRVYDNQRTTGLSTTAVRYQGTIGTSGADLNMVSTTISTNDERTLDSFTITVPTTAS